jgi:hypothetical protein
VTWHRLGGRIRKHRHPCSLTLAHSRKLETDRYEQPTHVASNDLRMVPSLGWGPIFQEAE